MSRVNTEVRAKTPLGAGPGEEFAEAAGAEAAVKLLNMIVDGVAADA